MLVLARVCSQTAHRTRCYAQLFAERFRCVPNHPHGQVFDLRLVPEKVENPLRRKNLEAHFRVLHAFLHLAFTRLIERVLQGIAGAMKGTPYANRYVTNLKPRACR